MTLSEQDLGKLDYLAAGNFSKVYLAPDLKLPEAPTGKWVYKKFKPKFRPIPAFGMNSIVTHRTNMHEDQRAQFDSVAVWPTRVVADDGAGAAGVVLPLIPDDYFHTLSLSTSTKRIPSEGQFLFMDREYCSSVGLTFLEEDARRKIAHRLAYAFALFHKANVVYGDFSSRNFIFRTMPTPRVLLVDCDAVRVNFEPSPFGGQPHSPDWEPPEALKAKRLKDSAGFSIQNMETDRYKLGLAILRVLTPGAYCSTNRDPERARAVLPPKLFQLLERSLSEHPTARPTAKEWYQEMLR